MDEDAEGSDGPAPPSSGGVTAPGSPSASIGAAPTPIQTTSEQDAKRREKIESLASAHRCAGTVTDLPPTASAGTIQPDHEG